ncbi:unnamed protein product [Tilletia controversa]|uniref:COP9 signalosome complex subunit 4 n=2 Tax=Tilletia TaxID=13289 RepID=A0A177VG20_9BASI|nr:hypothetical protein CF336_g6334 [Tilletia laevis]KAE8256722.1 hypothetical protein A4X03_0g5122 [Tilletia caries]CAD6905912.1 unnamed protein product [Tilletia controversa]KAE8191268.1 hypothetical protein CF335_g6132 [Tilletia laevis]CAD6893266.1 unnamed protein product [Tilletia caries]
MADFAAQLADIAAQPATSRSDAYIELYRQTVDRPESELPSNALESLTADYLDAAAFSDLNSTGGGLVVGRNVLSAFHKILSEARDSEDTGGAGGETKDDDDAVMQSSGSSRTRRAIDSPDTRTNIIDDALERLQPKVLSFEEQATQLRIVLSSILEAEHDWVRAARALQGIPLDGSPGQRNVSNLFRLRTYMRIVRLFIEGDDPIQADIFLKRASLLIHSVPGASSRTFGTLDLSAAEATAAASDPTSSSAGTGEQATKEAIQEGRELSLHFQLCQARIYDSQKKFAEAAMRFHKLSYVAEIDPSEREHMLSAAVTAAVLAPAGVTRTRILGTLIRDERTANLPSHQTAILTKVFLQQIVRPKEIAAFEEMLAPHQKAILMPSANEKAMLAIAQTNESARATDTEMDAGGASSSSASASAIAASKRHSPRTVLERAIIEHNLLAASKIYTTITLSGLGSLLDMSTFGAETIASRMIKERRLHAEIDQVEGVLTFLAHGAEVEGSGSGGAGAEAADDAGGRPSAVGGMTTSPLADLAGGDGSGTGEGFEVRSVYTRRWDVQIGRTASALEDVFQRISKMGGVVSTAVASATAAEPVSAPV